MNEAAKRRAAIVEIEKRGGLVLYYDESDSFTWGERPKWYSLLRRLHGDEHLGNPTQVNFLLVDSIADDDLAYLEDLTTLELIGFLDSPISDTGLEHLEDLLRLAVVRLENTKVTEEGVKKLQEALPNCEIVHNATTE